MQEVMDNWRSLVEKACSHVLSPIQLFKANHFWFYTDWFYTGLGNIKTEGS